MFHMYMLKKYNLSLPSVPEPQALASVPEEFKLDLSLFEDDMGDVVPPDLVQHNLDVLLEHTQVPEPK